MSENCNKSCGTCGEDCSERESQPKSLLEKPHECSDIKKVIAVVSGKGGVGKSLVTSMLAVSMNRMGYRTAVLDADVTGPSVPKEFGIKQKAEATESGILPIKTKTGISIMSVNLILENDTDPVIWRGPVISGMVKQFWTDVMWGDVDYMFIDMPPGTGDVPLTVFQSLPVDGIIIVTSPQELVSMIVSKALNMAELMNIPVIGIVENMSYLECPDCHKKINLFGKSQVEQIANQYGIAATAKLPLNPAIADLCDKGMIELFDNDDLKDVVNKVEQIGGTKMKIALPTRQNLIDGHFGHCEYFTVFTIDDNKKEILSQETVASPEGCGCKSNIASILSDMGVKVMLAGNMGEGAVHVLNNAGIEVLRGCSGDVKEVALQWINGALTDSGDSCHEHEHECHH